MAGKTRAAFAEGARTCCSPRSTSGEDNRRGCEGARHVFGRHGAWHSGPANICLKACADRRPDEQSVRHAPVVRRPASDLQFHELSEIALSVIAKLRDLLYKGLKTGNSEINCKFMRKIKLNSIVDESIRQIHTTKFSLPGWQIAKRHTCALVPFGSSIPEKVEYQIA